MNNVSKEELIKLGKCLVDSIVQACWVDNKGRPNLDRPTPRMTTAILNFREVFKEKCPTCLRYLDNESL